MIAAVHAKLLCKDYEFEWSGSGERDCSYCQNQCFSWWRTNVRFEVYIFFMCYACKQPCILGSVMQLQAFFLDQKWSLFFSDFIFSISMLPQIWLRAWQRCGRNQDSLSLQNPQMQKIYKLGWLLVSRCFCQWINIQTFLEIFVHWDCSFLICISLFITGYSTRLGLIKIFI